ncbi:MAG TPA: thiamine phosphate synthase [Candidatus Krumholzibacteria bacterium]|nr:thiamine phosphate synthase [Candidatus Krumholzibacteria bacterium]
MIDFHFYLVTDRTRCAPRSLASVVHDACVSGVRAVQLREKDLSEPDLVSAATRLLSVTRAGGARLLVNVSDFVEDDTAALLAGSPGVDGFHVPDNPALLAHFRGLFPALLIGGSVHSPDAADAAADAGADFVCFGPVYETPSKKQHGKPQGLDALARACTACSIPVFAIGGVTPENARACLDAGAHGVAAVGAVMGATSARTATRRFQEALGEL